MNTIGLAVQSVWIVGLVYLLLAFPSGRMPGRLDRWLVGGGLVAGVGLQLLAMLYGNKAGLRCPGCANNLLQVVHDNHKAQGWLGLQRLIGAVLIVTVIALLIRRWLRASAAQRRAVWPVLVAGCATLAALGWTVVFDLLGEPLGALPANVYFTLMATVPVAVLFVFLQRRLARGMLAGLVVELGGPSASVDLREALARALGDPSSSSRSGSRPRSLRRRRRHAGQAPGRGQRAALDIRRARRTADRRAAARSGARPQRRARALGVRGREPRA